MTLASHHQHRSGAPLVGRSVVVTRTRAQSRALAEPLEALGAEVVSCPVIEIIDPPDLGPVDAAIANLSSYDWVVLTSTNAVERFFARLTHARVGSDALQGIKIAAVGEPTARALTGYGQTADFVPPMAFRAEALAEEFVSRGAGPGWRVLVPRALKAREILPDTLRSLGAEVDVVPVYETVPAKPSAATLKRLRAADFDAVTFTSPSTVRNFLALLRDAGLDPQAVLSGVVLASIGPVTSDALRAEGFEAAVEPEPSTVPALVAALAERLSAG